MARMIPAHYDISTSSLAEKRLFDLFKNDAHTEGWVVIHSLGLTKRGRKPYGEIDFVVLIPKIGVFCLEVKGGGISCHDGEWQTTDRFGQVHQLGRSPFMQAREGMFSLRESITTRVPLSFPQDVVYGYGVIFPDVSFKKQSPEWESWQVIDHESLGKPISNAILRLAMGQRKMHPHSAPDEPSKENLKIIQQLLRPDFEVIVSRGTRIEESEEGLLKLTEDQYNKLDTLMDNERCFFEGPAGTGKTMLAFEYSRRSALSGKRTLLICYNRLLGDWFERETARLGAGTGLKAGSFHRILREKIIRSSASAEFLEQEASDPSEEFYLTKYPFYGLIALEEEKELFDVLVMDEAQDLLHPGVVEVLNAWLKGGLESGQWAIFGDFQRQAIFSKTTANELRSLVENSTLKLAKGRLTTNCRNTRNIGEETALMSGFDAPPYKMGQIAGLPVDYRYYNSDEDQCACLAEVIDRMLLDGVSPNEIIVVSSKRLENSCVSSVCGTTGFRLVGINEGIKGKTAKPLIRFSTIQAFKGMESTVIVLCDVENVSDGEPQSLLYVAMSRARSQLTVLLHKRVKPYYNECLRRRLTERWQNQNG